MVKASEINKVSVVTTTRTIVTGSYTGNDGTNRQVATGFKCSFVFIHQDTEDSTAATMLLIPNVSIALAGIEKPAYASLHATDGFVVGDGAMPNHFNVTSETYYYWAISE